jgi:hypothetical protein
VGVEGLAWPRALILELRGEVAAARETLAAMWDSQLRYTAGGWIGVGPDLVRLHLAAGDRDQAASVATDVEKGASGSDAASAAGAALRCRALVESDQRLMRQAIANYERGPRALDTAATRCQQGATHGPIGPPDRALSGEGHRARRRDRWPRAVSHGPLSRPSGRGGLLCGTASGT